MAPPRMYGRTRRSRHCIVLRGLIFPVLLSGALLPQLHPVQQVRHPLFWSTQPDTIEYNDFLPNPHPSLTGPDVVAACMDTMVNNHHSREEGLEVCFHFSSDRCRAAQGGSLENFRSYADNPTFGFLIDCDEWRTVSTGPVIRGTQHRGSMQTVLMSALKRSDATGDARRFLWTLQQERRPPLEGCWMVHEVLYVNNAFLQTV